VAETDTLAATRRSLHAVAEHVLAAALHAATGHIGLRAAPGGFATPPFPGPEGTRVLAVDGTDLVVTDGQQSRRSPLTTIGAAAAFAGIRPGAPAEVYTPVTPLEPDRALELDEGAAARLAAVFTTVASALEQLGASDTTAPEAQLWPEHFDLATTLSEVNYGGSPGDEEHPQPYLYVGPWTLPDTGDPYWNEPFGASTGAPPDLDVTSAVRFFDEGRARLAG